MVAKYEQRLNNHLWNYEKFLILLYFGKTIEKPSMSMVNLEEKKTFNGDGPVVAKPLKTIESNGAQEKKTLPSCRLGIRITIVKN